MNELHVRLIEKTGFKPCEKFNEDSIIIIDCIYSDDMQKLHIINFCQDLNLDYTVIDDSVFICLFIQREFSGSDIKLIDTLFKKSNITDYKVFHYFVE